MKTENNKVWQIFAHTTERLAELSCVASVDPDLWEGHGQMQIGIGYDELIIDVSNHPYLAMRTVTVTPVMHEETRKFFENTPVGNDARVERLRQYWDSNPVYQYQVYNSVWDTVVAELQMIVDHLHDQSPVEKVTYLNNITMKDMDDKIAKVANRYYKQLINRVPFNPNLVKDYSDAYIDRLWGESTDKDVRVVEKQCGEITKQIGELLKGLSGTTDKWRFDTKTPKIYDLYLSFKMEDYKIELALDRIPYILEGNPELTRTPINLEDWDEQDKHFIRVMIRQTQAIQKYIDELMLVGEGRADGIKQLVKPYYFSKVYHPLNRHMSHVWEFTNDTPETNAIIDMEMNKVLEMVMEKGKTLGESVYLDTTNWLLHTDGEFEHQCLLSDDDQIIDKHMEQYMGSFLRQLQTAIQISGSELLKPFSKPTEYDPNNTNVLNSSILN